VNTQVIRASASVTESVEVAAKIANVGTPCHFSSERGSGMKPIMFTVQMKRSSEAQYGNQRAIAFVGSPCSATWTWATS
jgi:hypothetical protein